jgi:hypothetical protein
MAGGAQMRHTAQPWNSSAAWYVPALVACALWTAALSSIVAYSPSLTVLLPTHSHATLAGIVPPHSHGAATTDPGQQSCVASDGATRSDIACGADETLSSGALAVPLGPVGVIAGAGPVTAAPTLETSRYASVTQPVPPPPPRT